VKEELLKSQEKIKVKLSNSQLNRKIKLLLKGTKPTPKLKSEFTKIYQKYQNL
jgi:hypothetical protein